MGLYNPAPALPKEITGNFQSFWEVRASVLGIAPQTTDPIVDENPDRIGLMLFNDGSGTAYIGYDGNTSTTNYAFPIYPGGFYFMESPIFTKQISCATGEEPANLHIRDLIG